MRVVRAGVLLAASMAVCELQGQALDAGQVLAAARDPCGGEKSLAAVKTFVATGRTRQIRGNNLVPIEFEISCELPNKFVRKDEVPAQDTDLTITAFRADELIQFPQAPPGRAGGPPAAPAGRDTPPPTTGRGG